jgi:hypothetical protein
MTFRIFQVSSDGVANPVYREGEAPGGARTPVAQQEAAAAAEWQRLRERLRADAATPPSRTGWLSR